MVDLSRPTSGVLGPESWFSDLFVSSLKGQFTGGLLLRSPEGDRALFFEDGDPVHAVGAGFSTHYLGQLVAEAQHLPTALVMEALQRHQSLDENDRPPFGELLVTHFNLAREDLEGCIRAQCKARFSLCFGLPANTAYQSAPGQNDRIRTLGLASDGWSILMDGLTEHGSDLELRETSSRLLGRSVKMKGSIRQLEALTAVPAALKTGLRYLEKPRKPDQLERALKRRRARGLLRTLELLDLLETGPSGRAVGIPKTTALKSQLPAPTTSPDPDPVPVHPPTTPTSDVPISDVPVSDVPSSRTKAGGAKLTGQLAAEVEIVWAKLEESPNHFEVMGIEPTDPPTVLRRRYTELVKKFHPDAFANMNVDEELMNKVRAISAKVNEAYNTLASAESRSEYETMLADDRIKGDVRRQALLADADMKCKKALIHIRLREYDKARVLLHNATELDPQNTAYKAHLAWAKINDPKQDRERALHDGLPDLEAAVRADPNQPTLHFYVGRAYKSLDRIEKALHHFKIASRLDPRYRDALREARLLSGRLEKKSKSSTTDDMKDTLRRFFRRDKKDGL